MALTPEDVSNKRFTAVRLREGYDMGEVDQFLDEVEAELGRLTTENSELRAKLEAVQSGAPVGAAAPAKVQEVKHESVAAPHPAVVVAPVAKAAQQTITVTTTGEASAAATRLLELAARNADELVTEAKAEAESILGAAKTNAEQLEAETRAAVEKLDADSKARAESLESDARSRSQMLDAETAERREALFGELEKERTNLDSEIEGLRSFEREYRGQLKSYFSSQLEALEGSGIGRSLMAGDDAPRRLKAILGEEGEV